MEQPKVVLEEESKADQEDAEAEGRKDGLDDGPNNSEQLVSEKENGPEKSDEPELAGEVEPEVDQIINEQRVENVDSDEEEVKENNHGHLEPVPEVEEYRSSAEDEKLDGGEEAKE